MKKFFLSVLSAVMLFMALGIIVEQTGAKLRSDQKALELISRARIAIGGDAALAEINNLVIKGRTSHNFDIDGSSRVESGETEIAFRLSGEYAKTMNLGNNNGWARTGIAVEAKNIDGNVVVARTGVPLEAANVSETIIVKGESVEKIELNGSGEFTTADGKRVVVRSVGGPSKVQGVAVSSQDVREIKVIQAEEAGQIIGDGKAVAFRAVEGQPIRNNELARVAMMLLLTPPKGMDVVYTFDGETSIDGVSVNTVNADFGGSSIKLHLDKFSNLPVAVDFSLPKIMAIALKKVEGQPMEMEEIKTVAIRASSADFVASQSPSRVKLSDYRLFNGIQLPYSWTTYADGKVTEKLEVTSYEINSANPMPVREGLVRGVEIKK